MCATCPPHRARCSRAASGSPGSRCRAALSGRCRWTRSCLGRSSQSPSKTCRRRGARGPCLCLLGVGLGVCVGPASPLKCQAPKSKPPKHDPNNKLTPKPKDKHHNKTKQTKNANQMEAKQKWTRNPDTNACHPQKVHRQRSAAAGAQDQPRHPGGRPRRAIPLLPPHHGQPGGGTRTVAGRPRPGLPAPLANCSWACPTPLRAVGLSRARTVDLSRAPPNARLAGVAPSGGARHAHNMRPIRRHPSPPLGFPPQSRPCSSISDLLLNP
jgi:hypothetical protein